MTGDVVQIAIGTLQGLASSTIFVLILFIGFCVVVGFTKTKRKRPRASERTESMGPWRSRPTRCRRTLTRGNARVSLTSRRSTRPAAMVWAWRGAERTEKTERTERTEKTVHICITLHPQFRAWPSDC